MMDKSKFTDLYTKYGDLVRRVCARRGVGKAEVDEVSQEVWTQLWKRRELWPDPEPSNPGAYLAKCAMHQARRHTRKLETRKRAGQHFPLEEDRTSTANVKVSLPASHPAEAEAFVERTSLGTLMRRFAERLPGEKKNMLLARLADKSDRRLSEEPSAVRRSFHRMVNACRRHLGVPTRDPGSARIDALQRLADVVHGTFEPSVEAGLDAEPTDAE